MKWPQLCVLFFSKVLCQLQPVAIFCGCRCRFWQLACWFFYCGCVVIGCGFKRIIKNLVEKSLKLQHDNGCWLTKIGGKLVANPTYKSLMRMPSPGKIISHPPEFMKMGWIQGKLCFTFPRSRLDNTGWPRCFFLCPMIRVVC